MKKIVSIFLSFIILSGLIPVSLSAYAADEYGLDYTLSDDGTYYIVTGFLGSTTDVFIPSEHNGLPVAKIGANAFEYFNVTSISIPDTMKFINIDAFKNCDLPYNEYNDAYYIGNDANPYHALIKIKDDATEIIMHNDTVVIKEKAFGGTEYWGNDTLEKVVIGDSVRYIPDNTFDEFRNLSNVTIGKSVEKIGAKAFSYCNSLTSINIPDSTKRIGNSAFEYCESLTEVDIGDSVTIIGDNAFCGCYELSSITFGNSVQTIGNSAFKYCDALTSINIPDSVIEIGDYAFGDIDNLNSVTIPKSIAKIGSEAFYNCDNLTYVALPDTVVLGSDIFSDCDNIQLTRYSNAFYYGSKENPYQILMYSIDDGITECAFHKDTKIIAGSAFAWCDDLTDVIIPDSVKTIGSSAFKYCDGFTSINIPDSVIAIGDSAFSYSDLTSIIIPDSVTYMEQSVFADAWWGDLEDIYCEAESKPYGWNDNWIGCDATVHWGYKPTVDEPSDKPSDEPSDETSDESSEPDDECEIGDVNADNEVNQYDYLLVKRVYFGTYTLTTKEEIYADVNFDKKVDQFDYILLKRIYFGTYSITISNGSNPIVIDAINYTKPITQIDPFPPSEGSHQCILPKINSSAPGAKTVNEKIYSEYGFIYETLLNNKEEHFVYHCDYDYKVSDNYLGIYVIYSKGPQGGGGSCEYTAYYYDTKNDKELTFGEYLSALGTSVAELTQKVKNDPVYSEIEMFLSPKYGLHLTDAIIGKDTTIVFYDEFLGYEDWSHSEIKS